MEAGAMTGAADGLAVASVWAVASLGAVILLLWLLGVARLALHALRQQRIRPSGPIAGGGTASVPARWRVAVALVIAILTTGMLVMLFDDTAAAPQAARIAAGLLIAGIGAVSAWLALGGPAGGPPGDGSPARPRLASSGGRSGAGRLLLLLLPVAQIGVLLTLSALAPGGEAGRLIAGMAAATAGATA